MAQIGNHHNAQLDENMLRHMILNTLRFNRNKFGNEYGEFIICADDKDYWRKKSFPYYKARRKMDRQKSELDWNTIFCVLNKVREELKEFFPYKVIQIDHAEADDIIGTIVHEEGQELNTGEKILILSGDKDYIQLHKYANVNQYDPTRKKWIRHSDPTAYLREHIIRGDAGDGVPNILSNDNCLVVGERQKPITKKRLSEWTDNASMDENVLRNFHRNRMLIDLELVPDNIKQEALERYHTDEGKDRSLLLNYFIKNKLRTLMEHINEF